MAEIQVRNNASIEVCNMFWGWFFICIFIIFLGSTSKKKESNLECKGIDSLTWVVTLFKIILAYRIAFVLSYFPI